MKTNSASATSGINAFVVVLGILALLLIFAVLTGRKVPFLASEQATLLTLVIIGMFICSRAGIGQVAARGAWWHPISVIGYVLGTTIIAIGIAALFGRHIPPLTNYHQSFITVTVIAAIKILLTAIHRLFW